MPLRKRGSLRPKWGGSDPHSGRYPMLSGMGSPASIKGRYQSL